MRRLSGLMAAALAAFGIGSLGAGQMSVSRAELAELGAIRQTTKASNAAPAVPAARVTQGEVIAAVRGLGGLRAWQAPGAIWVGYMRAGGGPVWRVGSRGGRRVGRS